VAKASSSTAIPPSPPNTQIQNQPGSAARTKTTEEIVK
jgi:hypothetical protein